MSNLFVDPGPEGRRVMLATTAYDSPDASYTHALAKSREVLRGAGFPSAYVLLQGNCHVDDARNTVLREFLRSDCEDLVFIDADVSWEPEHLVALCEYDCDVVGGVYPYRREGRDNMPVRFLEGVRQPDENGLMEVEGLPTGFLRIRRHVIEKMADKTFNKDADEPVPLIFERDILNGGRRGGDIRFCMKWREMGGKVHAAANLRLGHTGKQITRDSLAAFLRRTYDQTLSHVVERIRNEEETTDDYAEVKRGFGTPWTADIDVLSSAVLLARKAQGPIIEAGSGLSTILMAAATDQMVWCLEHNPLYVHILNDMTQRAGVKNIAAVLCPLKDGWYDLTEDMDDLPTRFAVGLVDGPPRLMGDRMKFFDVFGDRTSVILIDDADDRGYRDKLGSWAEEKGRPVQFGEYRSAVILQAA